MAEIQNISEYWEGHSGSEVEAFIKSQLGGKAGWFTRTEDNKLLAFASEDDYISWQTDPENNPPLVEVSLPSMTQEDVYQVRVYLESTPNELQRSRDVSINVRGTSIVQLATGGTENIQETLDILVETSPTGASGTWTSRRVGSVPSNLQEYRTFSLQNYLSIGTNYVRIRARGNNATSIPVSFTINVVDLYLTSKTDFESPFSGVVTLAYLIGGSIDKTIEFQFGTGRGSSFQSVYATQVALGTQTNTQTAKQFQFDRQEILTAGRHSVRARLYVNETMYTDWVESEYMVAGSSKMVILNDIQNELSNWTAVRFFDWAAYTPDNEEFNVVFKLYDENDTNLFTSWTFPAQNGQKYSFTTQLSLNIADNISVFGGVMHIEDEDGNTLCPSVDFNFVNSAEFSPVSGADFVMIPANRNNGEANKDTIINEAGSTPSVVGSTFTGFGWLNDGWVNVPRNLNNDEAGTLRALHIPAGHKVEINYNPFSDFTGNSNTGKNATFELDFRTSNILDDEEAVVRIGTLVNNKIWGFEMLPTKAYMLTSENNTIEDQDVDWAEEVRTHLAVNIVTVVYSNTTLNYVRIFINGIIEREFLYNTTDRFTAPNVTIELGNSSCDLDVFGIRSYKTALTTADVMKDYRASMDSVDEKLAFKERNDITVNDAINFAKCIEKGFNVIGHTGPLPKYGKADGNPTYEGVKLQIHIDGDTEHSGILTDLEAKGQGTTAMTYYDWNQSYKITDATKHLTEEGVQKDIEDGKGYAIASDEYKAKKLVGKINFASSMQSHKLGLTWIFTEVFKALVNQGTISRPSQMEEFPDSRIAVFEKPFLFFHRETENDDWTYKYLMTFGAGKGDKPTFGFDKNATGDMLMVEGADNDPALCNFAMPWDDSVTYNASKEAWYVGSTKSINFGFGKTSVVGGEEIPSSSAAINAIKAFWNFVYEHHTGISYYNGSLQNLKDGEPLVDGDGPVRNSGLYWIAASGANQYCLFRYDSIDGWIPAGANKTTFNLREQYKTLNNNVYPSWSGKTNQQINNEIKAIRRTHFKANAESYFHVDDALYHSCFIKLFAGTDNRAKNTYYYTDPTTLKIRWMQDDLDTVIKTNNLGQNRKPYYVEEHDKDAYGAYYWQGERNGFYNLLEECYTDDSNNANDRMGSMMRAMLGVMSSIGGTVMGYFLQRLIFVQDYFPAIAYNEQARLVYEAAQAAQTGSNPIYGNSIQAITQSCGSQRWSEYQWLLDRIMYISSWCAYGEFAEGTVSSGALSWRSNAGQFNFVLTPAKWLYPKIGKGTSNIPAASVNGVPVNRVRCQPKVPFSYLALDSEGDTDIYLRGIHYMLDIGDMNVYLKPAPFGFTGRRLQEINVNPNGTDENKLAASSISNTATNIKSFVLRNVDTVSGTIDLSKCYRLEHIDIRGSSFTGITLPPTERLTSLALPSTLTALVIENLPNLSSVSLEGAANLQRIKITGSPQVASYALVNTAKNANAPLTEVVLHNINWSGVDAAMVDWLADIPTCELTGTIAISNSTPVSFELRKKMLAKWGNLGDTLTITFTRRSLTGVAIGGERYIYELGQYEYGIIPSPNNANDFDGIEWSVAWADAEVATLADVVDIDLFERTGILDVKQLFNTSTAVLELTATIGSVSATYEVGLYQRAAALGDFVFEDGTYSDKANPLKKAVGVCFYINPEDPTDRRMVGVENLYLPIQYQNTTTNITQCQPYNNASWGGIQNLATTDTPVFSGIYKPPVQVFNNATDANANIGLRTIDISTIRTVFPNANANADNIVYGNFSQYLGKVVPAGMWNTIVRIMARNRVVLDGNYNFEAPYETEQEKEWDSLIRCITAAVVAKSNINYNTLFYPAASMCFAYAPCEKFGLHKWYCPTVGELTLIYTNTKSVFDANPSICKALTGNTWSSDGHSVSYVGLVNVGTGAVTLTNGGNGAQSGNKVFPCCQF